MAFCIEGTCVSGVNRLKWFNELSAKNQNLSNGLLEDFMGESDIFSQEGFFSEKKIINSSLVNLKKILIF